MAPSSPSRFAPRPQSKRAVQHRDVVATKLWDNARRDVERIETTSAVIDAIAAHSPELLDDLIAMVAVEPVETIYSWAEKWRLDGSALVMDWLDELLPTYEGYQQNEK